MKSLITTYHFVLDKLGINVYKGCAIALSLFMALLPLNPLHFNKQKIAPMLTINVSHSAEGARQYFKEGLSKEGNYYLDQQIKAFWAGKTSKRLGLEGKEVTEQDFTRLVNNRHPYSNEKLTPRDAENRRAMVDLTFSAPKDFSLLYAFTQSPELLEIHRNACQTAMQEVEKLMYTQNNSRYARGYTYTGNIIYSGFEHHLSRPVEVEHNGQKLQIAEPNLHTHCTAMNVTWNEKTGHYHALEIYNAHMNSDYIRSVYHSTLAIGLEKAGYQTGRDGNFVRIAGIPRDVIERFSSRTQEINRIAEEKGLSALEKGELGAKTRLNKSALSLSDKELLQHWESRLSPEELRQLTSLKGKRFEKPAPIPVKEAVDRSLEHFFERHSAINEKKVIAEALRLGYGHLTHDKVSAELNSRENILRSERDTISYITTSEMVRQENHMIARAVEGKGKSPALNKDYEPKLDFLNDQQNKAIKDILGSYDQTVILRGAAGVGKTTLLTEIKKGAAQSQKPLFAVAPSTQAVEVLREKGFEADTIAGLLHSQKKQENLQDKVLLIEEAGMVGTQDMTALLDLAEKHKSAKTILSGDSKQHSSPAYGDALRILETQGNIQVSNVDKIVRQKPEQYRSAIEDLANGKTLKGFQKLDKQGAVKEIVEHDERLDRLAEDYIKTLEQKQSSLIVSPTHLEGDKINEIVREKLKEKRIIRGEEKSFETLKDLSLTDAQKKDALTYQKGQVIRYAKNSKGGFKAGSHYEVTDVLKDNQVKVRDLKTGREAFLPYETPEHYAVHTKQDINLAQGDRIRLTNNATSLEGTKMSNGTNYEVMGFTKRGIRLSNNKHIPNDLYHLKYSHCETSHASQGKDAQKIIISMSSMSYAATNDKAFYVSSSRGVKEIAIYCDDKNELKKAIQRSGERLTAREVAFDHQKRMMMQRKQREHYNSIIKNKEYNERIAKREKTFARVVSQDLSRG